MNIVCEIKSSEKFSFNNVNYVRLQGFGDFGNGKMELFQQTVNEKLVPDNLEGKYCVLEFSVGVSKFKPYLKLLKIQVQ